MKRQVLVLLFMAFAMAVCGSLPATSVSANSLLPGSMSSPASFTPKTAPPQPGTPAARGYHLIAYDVQSKRVILAGGEPNPFGVYTDTWTYHPNSRKWRAMHPAQTPTGFFGPMAYATRADRVIMYIGYALDPSVSPPFVPRGETQET